MTKNEFKKIAKTLKQCRGATRNLLTFESLRKARATYLRFKSLKKPISLDTYQKTAKIVLSGPKHELP